MRFIISFFFFSRYTVEKKTVGRERGASILPFNGSFSLSSRKKWKLDTSAVSSGVFFFFFYAQQHSVYMNFSRFTRARTKCQIGGRRETSRRRLRDSVPSFEEVCSIVLEQGERGRGKNEKVSNLIRVRITSPDASRRFPSGATLCLYTIIGVWDPGVPLSVFSAPLDSGTPHCNLSELQFALLSSPEFGLVDPPPDLLIRILFFKNHIYFRDPFLHRSVVALLLFVANRH